MLTFVPFENTILDLFKGKHDFSTHDIKLYLTNVAPDAAAHKVKADLAEIATGNGYSGPLAITVDGVSQTDGTGELAVTLPEFVQATGGEMSAFRYIVLFNDSATNKPLIASWDYGESVTLKDQEKFNFAMTGSVILEGVINSEQV